MATYGVTSAGWVSKPLSTIESEVDTDLKSILGNSAGTEPDGSIPAASFAGQLKALIVDGFAAPFDLGQAIYSSLDPNQTSGASQDVVGAITGTIREAAQYSTATGLCIGTAGTVLPVGRVASVTSAGSRFDTTAEITLAAATAWAALTGYVVGDLRTNSGSVYRCITTGTSAGAGGPTTTSTDITDGSAHWRYIGSGTAVTAVLFQAEAVGAVGAVSGTLATIETPVAGWNAIYNAADAAQGRAREGDAAFRVRRDEELAAPGNTTRDAIRANILKVNEGSTNPAHTPPTDCEVFVNDTDLVDANGVPGHSIEVLVQDGTDADIALAVFNSVGAGTRTFGNQTSTVTDSQGNSQIVYWTRPTAVPIYVTATVYYDASQWPAGSDAQVAQAALSALLTYTSSGRLPIGQDVRSTPLIAAILRGPSETDTSKLAVVPAVSGSAAIPGALEVTPLYIGTAASPLTSTAIAITARQYASFQSGQCVITATSETP